MRINFCITVFLSFASSLVWAQVPSVGSPENLDIATWNIEWFGDPNNGPSNLLLQKDRVEQVIKQSGIDIWAFQEISNEVIFNAMMSNLPAYSFVLAQYTQTQKTAFIWKVAEWEYIADRHILTSFASTFAGRPPLELMMRERLTGDTFCFINIHLKANVGSLAERRTSWVQRKQSAEILVDYVINELKYKTIVLGDWNDDVDFGIFVDSGSALASILTKPEVKFVTERISRAGERSYVFSNAMIDHLLMNEPLMEMLIDSLTAVLYLDRYFTSYSSTVSDHFPVHASFKKEKKPGLYVTNRHHKLIHRLYPNPSKGWFKIELTELPLKIELCDYLGAPVLVKPEQITDLQYEIRGLTSGVYILKVITDVGFIEERLLVFE